MYRYDLLTRAPLDVNHARLGLPPGQFPEDLVSAELGWGSRVVSLVLVLLRHGFNQR